MCNEMRRASALYQIMCMKEHQSAFGQDENSLLEPLAFELANCDDLDFDKIDLLVDVLCVSVFNHKEDDATIEIKQIILGLSNG
jgi:hypothetical protein